MQRNSTVLSGRVSQIPRQSIGPRIYSLEVTPGERFRDTEYETMIREAAFQLSAPSSETLAPWLDVANTVRESSEP